MSIFHISDITQKPSSYTRDQVNKEINYQSIKNEVRTSIIDKYSSFDKLGKQAQSPSRRESPKKYNNTMRTLDILFGKTTKEEPLQGSPAKISGLKKKMQQIGGSEIPTKYTISQHQDFKTTYYENSSKQSFLSPQTRLSTQESKLLRSGSLTAKFQDKNVKSGISSIVPIQRLVEMQNILELTPASELQALPRNYLDELARVSASITRNLRHHNDIRLKV